MTDPKPTEAPTIFGNPMTSEDQSVWIVEVCGLTVMLWHNGVKRWIARVSGQFLSLDAFESERDAALRSLERKICRHVLSLAPLLGDDTKRELVKVAGIGLEHFHDCKDETPQEEVEPLL